MTDDMKQTLRNIPKTDVFLAHLRNVESLRHVSEVRLKAAAQQCIGQLRQDVLQGVCAAVPAMEELETAVQKRVTGGAPKHLRCVVNATGTVLHTNLGRAVLHKRAVRHAAEIAGTYSNLEYDLEMGKRGSRYNHVNQLLCRLTGAEDALIVNNNAAAVLLVLSSMTKGKEVVISRGELVEIGGMFRIPEVLALSGSVLREVGTTNKTHLDDYKRAITEDTGALMKVHTSNYRIIGFSGNVDGKEIGEAAHEKGLPFIQDLGSGLLVPMTPFGLPYEPTVQEVVSQGCDIVTFSGDKLLGGPQAGIIVGKKKYIDAMKKNQLLRALRVDKMTLAALESTLQLYEYPEVAAAEIPVLQMLALTEEQCRQKAAALRQQVISIGDEVQAEIVPCEDMVGGGAYPEYLLAGYAVAVSIKGIAAEQLKDMLRGSAVPVIARVQNGTVYLSVRTIEENQYGVIADMLQQILL